MKRSLSILLVMTLVLSLLMPAVVVAEEMLLPDIAAFAGDKLTVGEMADYEYCIQQTYTGSAENIQAVADAYIRLLKDKYNLLNTFSYTANVEDSYLRYDLAFIAKAAPDGFEVFTMNDSTYGYSANDCHLFICYTQLAGSNENFLQITYSSSFTYADTGDRLSRGSVSTDAPEPVVEATPEPTAEPAPEPTAAADVPQGYHTFVEPAVEKAVREALGKETGEISYEELLGITEIDLDLYDEELASVEDLRYMTNLSSLVMFVRNLSDISPLAELTNLSSLSIHGGLGDHRNILSDLSPLSGLTNLKSLELYANRISDISPLAGLINLAELDLTANKICDLSPLAGLTNLTSLGLSGNDISDISPLAGLTNLVSLGLNSNHISDLSPLAGLTNLTELFLWYNSISDISPLSGLTNLSNLWLSGNNITDFSPIDGLELETLMIDEPATPTPAPTATPSPYKAPIVGNDGLLVMSAEEYLQDRRLLRIDACDDIYQQDNWYAYQYTNRGYKFGRFGTDNPVDWHRMVNYVDALVDSGYYQVVLHEKPEDDREYWYLSYIGPGSVKRVFSVYKDVSQKAAIIVTTNIGHINVFYSLDVITNDLEDTQYRLNKHIDVDNPRPAGGGGGGGSPSVDDREEKCSICGGSGRRTCGSCHGSGDIDCGGCYGNEPCSQCGGDGRRDCPNINCRNGEVDCWTCGGDGKK